MRGDCQRAFAEAAASDRIKLSKQSFPWLCERGHAALPEPLADTRNVLERIFLALGGDLDALAAGRRNPLPGDFLHEPTRTLIETDEPQHFTSFRLLTLEMYSNDAPVGFDIQNYQWLCRRWCASPDGDGYRRNKPARCFGIGGRQRLRAYYDALRNLATPAMGYPPLVRVACPDRDGRAAYIRNRDRLAPLLGPIS
jgi:hypothetical protein